MYDASGFSMMPPYYHRDTGTLYDNDGFDIYGNSQDDGVADDMYDAGGFSMMPPYYHRDTGTFYNMMDLIYMETPTGSRRISI